MGANPTEIVPGLVTIPATTSATSSPTAMSWTTRCARTASAVNKDVLSQNLFAGLPVNAKENFYMLKPTSRQKKFVLKFAKI